MAFNQYRAAGWMAGQEESKDGFDPYNSSLRDSPEHGNLTSTSASSASASSSPKHAAASTPAWTVSNPPESHVHYRTNFGKNMSYKPPPTYGSPVRNSPPRPVRGLPPSSPRLAAAFRQPKPPEDDDSDVPFDQKPDAKCVPFDEGHAKQETHNPPSPSRQSDHDGDSPIGRFIMAPPRLSEPTSMPASNSVASSIDMEEWRNPKGSLESMRDLKLSLPHDVESTDGSSLAQGYEEFNLRYPKRNAKMPQSILKKTTIRMQDERKPVDDSEESEEDDSLFDFAERRPRSSGSEKGSGASGGRRASRRRRFKSPTKEEDGDDTSLEFHYGSRLSPSSLQERTQQAWASRRAQLKAPSARLSPRPIEPNAKFTPIVSFGNEDTIHHFQPDPDETTQFTGGTYDRSLNSEYTKSIDSEVEDLVKDLFFIGSGRSKNRPQRPQPPVAASKEQVKSRNTSGGTTSGYENPLSSVWTALGNALIGPFEDMEEKQRKRAFENSSYNREGEESTLASEITFPTLTEDPPSDEAAEEMATINEEEEEEESRITSKKSSSSSGGGGFVDFMDYASDLFLASSSSCDFTPSLPSLSSFPTLGSEKEELSRRASPTTEAPPAQPETQISAPALENDPRLVDLALQAARSLHQIHGIQFDESLDVDIVSEVRFIVVQISLPLGVLFQENDVGCWAAKIMISGNAARSGSIRVGDQLAAIGGKSAIGLKVDGIFTIVSEAAAKSSEIELTFLRYVGPLRPAPGKIEEEGYEVQAVKQKEGQRMVPTTPPRQGNAEENLATSASTQLRKGSATPNSERSSVPNETPLRSSLKSTPKSKKFPEPVGDSSRRTCAPSIRHRGNSSSPDTSGSDSPSSIRKRRRSKARESHDKNSKRFRLFRWPKKS